MSRILAIDSSTEACSVALFDHGEVLTRYQLAPREHSRLLLPMVEELLAEASLSLTQLDALAYGRGPGGFTGLRICVATAQGLAYGADLGLAPVSSLQAMAQELISRQVSATCVLSAIDARMGEVYWGIFDASGKLAHELSPEKVTAPDLVVAELDKLKPEYALGSGCVCGSLSTYRFPFQEPQLYPRAEHMLPQGLKLLEEEKLISAEQALPTYLRNEVSWQKRQRLRC